MASCLVAHGEHKAIGAYQLHKIFVRDVNRILEEDKYTYEDRWDRDKSREMTRIYITHYTGIAEWYKTTSPTLMDRFECMSRVFNGGPDGYKEEATKKYWLKVKARLEGKQ